MTEPARPSTRERIIQKIGGYSAPLVWWRARRPAWAWRLSSPYGKPTSRFADENGLAVLRGEFEGLGFPPSALGHTNYLGAKLIGTYEPPVISFLCEQAPAHDLFVDFGSGDGFFPTGLGRLNSDLRLIGYEVNGYEQKLAGEIARLNGVTLEARTLASQDELRKLPEGRLLLLCDLEGLEEDFLDPEAVDRLKDTTMAVEVHSQFRPNVIDVLNSRFRETHEIEHFHSTKPDPESLPELKGWSAEEARLIIHDGHEPTEGWMTFVPRN